MSASSLCLTRTSLGKKYLMGLTGLAWAGFVLTHMLGNLLIFVGPEAYNKYSHALVKNPFLPIAEIGLVVLLLAHVFTAMKLTFENRLLGRRATRWRRKVPSALRLPRAQWRSRVPSFSSLSFCTFVTFKHDVLRRELTTVWRCVPHPQAHYRSFPELGLRGLVCGLPLVAGLPPFPWVRFFLPISRRQSSALYLPDQTHWNRLRGLGAAGFIAQPLYVFLVAR